MTISKREADTCALGNFISALTLPRPSQRQVRSHVAASQQFCPPAPGQNEPCASFPRVAW